MLTWNPDDLQQAIESNELIFLKLWKKGCGPCKLSKPALERLETSDELGIKFAEICTDDYPEMFEIAQTDVLPAFFIFQNKKMLGKSIGFKGFDKLKSFIEDTLLNQGKGSS